MAKRKGKHYTYKTKDRLTRTPLKTRGEFMYSGRIASGTRRVTLVTNPVTSHE